MSWSEALVQCVRQNMTLATIESPEETARARRVVADVVGTLNYFWTAGVFHDYWMWMPSGQPIESYDNWIDGHPYY